MSEAIDTTEPGLLHGLDPALAERLRPRVPPARPVPLAPPGKGRGSPRRRFVAAFATVVTVSLLAYPLLPRRYEAVSEIVMLPSDQDGQSDRSLRAPMDENAIQSGLDLISSPNLADAVIARNRLADDPEFTGGILATVPGWIGGILGPRRDPDPARAHQLLRRSLQGHLLVSRDRRSYTVRLGYWAATPEKATALASSLLTAFLAEQRARKRAAIEHVSGWMAKRAEALQVRYDASRGAVEAFMAASGLIDTGAQSYLDQRLQVLGVEAGQARARQIETAVRAERLAAMKASGEITAAPEVLASPSVLRLKEAMAAALARTAVWSSETKALEGEIAREADRILAAAGAEAANWANREKLLLAEIESVRGETRRRREAEARQRELQRVADSDRIALDDAQQRLKAMTARAEAATPDAEVIAAAEPPTSAAFPRPFLVLLAALLMGALAGFAVTWRETLALARRLAKV